MQNRIYYVSLATSAAVTIASAAIALLYVYFPEWLPAVITVGMVLNFTGISLLYAGVMTWWMGLIIGKEWRLWFGVLLLYCGYSTLVNEIPTLPRHGMWPQEQIEIQILWSVFLLGLYNIGAGSRLAKLSDTKVKEPT
ncbi:MAG: hypothetical protein HYT30_01050 [Parcubacteria group bacterium]|nr:hypothetical protein [Parcubacteria group bacterium]